MSKSPSPGQLRQSVETVEEIGFKSPASAASHGLLTVEECGCPPKPWRRRTGASAGYAAPKVPRALARGAPPPYGGGP
jgi:hypothetical protein